jgi:hypothetical protein
MPINNRTTTIIIATCASEERTVHEFVGTGGMTVDKLVLLADKGNDGMVVALVLAVSVVV